VRRSPPLDTSGRKLTFFVLPVADMWIFLLAGHETTAHTLAFLLTLLALYPEHQHVLHDEASACGEHTTYSDFTSFVRLSP
jgi:cytochrome P450